MKTLLRLAAIVWIFSACSTAGTIKEDVVKEFEDGKPQQVNFYQVKGDTQVLIKEKTFYPNGQLRSEGGFTEGEIRSGKWTFWYSDGTKWSEATFDNGLENGTKVSYYPNGIKRFEGLTQSGKRIGKWIFFHEDGRIALELDYDKKN